MKPVIAIVGRPNVGKSTLFNRLTGGRQALVAGQPGVTRDFLVGDGRWQRPLLFIDTAGLTASVPAEDPLAAELAEQCRHVVEEADRTIWLVDGRVGRTPEDELLALQLRRWTQRCVLAVNKTEGMDESLATADFYALGFPAPVAVSALHGRGLGVLRERLTADLPPAEAAASERDGPALRIAVIGRPNVGKSTLVNRLLGKKRMLVSDRPGTTRDSVANELERFEKRYLLVDTAGIRRRSRVTGGLERLSVVKALQAMERAQVVLVLGDATEGVTAQDCRLLGVAAQRGKRLVFALNKWDRLGRDARKNTLEQVERSLRFAPYADVRYLSALHGSGLNGLFEAMERAARSLEQNISTAQLNRILQAAVRRHPPPSSVAAQRRARLLYAHLGGREPLRIVVHGRRAKGLTPDYRRYLANCFARELRLTGTPVSIECRLPGETALKEFDCSAEA